MNIRFRVPLTVVLSLMVVTGCDDGSGQEFVKKKLKSPASAEFPSIVWDSSEISVAEAGPNSFLVVAYVDAQNAFGAQIRTRYRATMKYVGGDEGVSARTTG